jgi:hypothetical protein
MAEEGLLPRIRSVYERAQLGGIWEFCMAPDGPHGKAKRFDAAARFAGNRKEESTGAERDRWREVQEVYRERRDHWEDKYESQHQDAGWPEDMPIAELLYHLAHTHIASPDREKLIQVCKIADEKFNCRVGEFPPFDPVECVHANPGSWHYRDSGSPWTSRYCSNRGNGLAADINDWDGGSDQEYAFYIECKRRYT